MVIMMILLPFGIQSQHVGLLYITHVSQLTPCAFKSPWREAVFKIGLDSWNNHAKVGTRQCSGK